MSKEKDTSSGGGKSKKVTKSPEHKKPISKKAPRITERKDHSRTPSMFAPVRPEKPKKPDDSGQGDTSKKTD